MTFPFYTTLICFVVGILIVGFTLLWMWLTKYNGGMHAPKKGEKQK